MPRSAGDLAPHEYVVRGQWPTGRLKKGAPLSAVYGQQFVLRLTQALKAKGEPSLHAVEREAQVSRRTVERTLKGEVLPDFGAIARLEEWLGADLWPGPEIRAGRDGRATREDDLDQG